MFSSGGGVVSLTVVGRVLVCWVVWFCVVGGSRSGVWFVCMWVGWWGPGWLVVGVVVLFLDWGGGFGGCVVGGCVLLVVFVVDCCGRFCGGWVRDRGSRCCGWFGRIVGVVGGFVNGG